MIADHIALTTLESHGLVLLTVYHYLLQVSYCPSSLPSISFAYGDRACLPEDVIILDDLRRRCMQFGALPHRFLRYVVHRLPEVFGGLASLSLNSATCYLKLNKNAVVLIPVHRVLWAMALLLLSFLLMILRFRHGIPLRFRLLSTFDGCGNCCIGQQGFRSGRLRSPER